MLFIFRVFGRYTMDAIAALGFGMDTESQTNPNDTFVKYAKELFNFGVTPLLILICEYTK
jgi:hypothetical protein